MATLTINRQALTEVKLNAYKINKLKKQPSAVGTGAKSPKGPKKIRYLRVEDEYWDGFVELAKEREQIHGNLFRDMYLAFQSGLKKNGNE